MMYVSTITLQDHLKNYLLNFTNPIVRLTLQPVSLDLSVEDFLLVTQVDLSDNFAVRQESNFRI